jgi:hypothetical protein
MSISTTPLPAPPKKRGIGCLGCGCLVLALLVILFAGLMTGGFYMGYKKIAGLTSTTPAAIPSFDGGDDVYNAAEEKIRAFGHDVENHQAATIQLSADELNTLIARNPAFIQQKAQLFVTLTDDQARIQGSIPTNALIQGIFTGRCLNFDTTFGLGFDSDTKSLEVTLHHLQISDQTMPQNLLPTMQAEFAPFLNAALQKNPETKNFLDQAKSVGITNGELVLETQ